MAYGDEALEDLTQLSQLQQLPPKPRPGADLPWGDKAAGNLQF